APSVDSLTLGNKRTRRPDVRDAESRSLEPTKINAAQMISGPYRQNRLETFASRPARLASAVIRDCSLPQIAIRARGPGLDVSLWYRASLVSQCFDGIECRGFACRIVAKEDADGG